MMQQFDNEKGKGRNLTILNMTAEEADVFYAQFPGLPEELQRQCAEELKRQISKSDEGFLEWILAIHSKENELVGRIEVTSFDGRTAAVRIQIPNRDLALKEGIEVVEQFLEICRNNHYFDTIELVVGSFITKMYSSARNLGSKIINVA